MTVQAQDNVASSWANKLEYCKAVRVFAAEKKVAIKDVTEDMLEGHELGIKGLAGLYESTPNARPQPGGDGTCSGTPQLGAPPAAKAKAKAKAGKGKERTGGPTEGSGDDPMQGLKEGSEPADHENNRKKAKKTAGSKTSTTTKKERELKELLAMEAQSDQTMTEVTAGMGKDPTGWSWARDFINAYKTFRKDILELYADNEFFRQAKVAALSSKETQRLKKEHKDDYVTLLCEFTCKLGPKIQGMYECTVKIRQMAAAQANAVASPKPSSKGSARKPKRSASQASLSC